LPDRRALATVILAKDAVDAGRLIAGSPEADFLVGPDAAIPLQDSHDLVKAAGGRRILLSRTRREPSPGERRWACRL
jgi:hypothetical protein